MGAGTSAQGGGLAYPHVPGFTFVPGEPSGNFQIVASGAVVAPGPGALFDNSSTAEDSSAKSSGTNGTTNPSGQGHRPPRPPEIARLEKQIDAAREAYSRLEAQTEERAAFAARAAAELRAAELENIRTLRRRASRVAVKRPSFKRMRASVVGGVNLIQHTATAGSGGSHADGRSGGGAENFESVAAKDACLAAFDHDDTGYANVRDVLRRLKQQGFSPADARVAREWATIQAQSRSGSSGTGTIALEALAVLASENLLVDAALRGTLVVPEFDTFCTALVELYNETYPNKGGACADYIPQLAVVNPEQYGLAVCTVQGQRFAHGDAAIPFCVQSSSKPVTYCMATELHGEEKVHKHIGHEPNGRAFNATVLKKPEGIPHNPFINAGAIMAASLVKMEDTEDARFDYVTSVWSRLTGNGKIGFQNSTYMGERATASRNFCLGYMMLEEDAFPANTDLIKTLESYFMYCSIEITCEQMSVVAATLANGGICPLTEDRIFQKQTVTHCLSLMLSCGMYDYSGEWGFLVGIPTKSGVSGVLCIVVPGVTGISTWSPRLDALGNSVRGVDFCKALCRDFPFHPFSVPGSTVRALPTKGGHESEQRAAAIALSDSAFELSQGGAGGNAATGADHAALWWAASCGDLRRVKMVAARGVSLSAADYDARTALHLAASEGHADVVAYLVAHGAAVSAADRLGNTPLDDARRGGHDDAVAVLQQSAVPAAGDAPPSTPGQFLFSRALDASNRNAAPKSCLRDVLAQSGVHCGAGHWFEPAVAALEAAAASNGDANAATIADFEEVFPARKASRGFALGAQQQAQCRFVGRALTGSLTVPNWSEFQKRLGALATVAGTASVGNPDAGAVCADVPLLARANPAVWSCAACSVDGQRASFGDAAATFSAQQLIRPALYAACQDLLSLDAVHTVCGREPTGDSSTLLTLNEDGLPFNPLSTSGALNLVGLLRAELARRGAADDPTTRVRALWGALTGGAVPPATGADVVDAASTEAEGDWVRIDDERGSGGTAMATVDEELVAQQQGPAANRLRSVGRYLRHVGCFPDKSAEGLSEAIDATLAMGAVKCTTGSLAVLASTLAHGGVCPLTQRRVLSAEAVKNTLSVMFTCGLDVESGDFSYTCGVPAKTNKCGAIMMVVPGVFGCAFYSPEVNAAAQPLKGWAFARAMADTMCVHRYRQTSESDVTGLFDMKLYDGSTRFTEVGNLLTAAQSGDLMEMKRIHMQGTDLDAVDYDMRSAAHLAAAGGSLTVLAYLHENGANLCCADRWGVVPLQDAEKVGSSRCVNFLRKLQSGN